MSDLRGTFVSRLAYRCGLDIGGRPWRCRRRLGWFVRTDASLGAMISCHVTQPHPTDKRAHNKDENNSG